MRLLVLQDQVFLPSLGGGNKGSRLLLEGLSRRGHHCAAIAAAFTGRAGPANEAELVKEMDGRGVVLERISEGHYALRHQGIEVEALDFRDAPRSRAAVSRRIHEFAPDWVVVTDDKPRFLLECAMDVAPERVISILQTVVHLPFGPCATRPSDTQADLLRRARARLVISRFLRQYLERHGQTDAIVVRMPVYGPGPFPVRGRFDRGLVTMVNPCVEKGLPIFAALARRFPAVGFGAVPTWGADAAVLGELASLPNVRVLPPADDIDEILADTRVLLVPSLWPETFGYVVVDAMVRGIPVLASDIGGLGEAKLGVDYLLPVVPASLRGRAYVSPPQDIEPWAKALGELLGDKVRYRECAERSREAALGFVRGADPVEFEHLLDDLAATRTPTDHAHGVLSGDG